VAAMQQGSLNAVALCSTEVASASKFGPPLSDAPRTLVHRLSLRSQGGHKWRARS
jgi:hypothetical protein